MDHEHHVVMKCHETLGFLSWASARQRSLGQGILSSASGGVSILAMRIDLDRAMQPVAAHAIQDIDSGALRNPTPYASLELFGLI